MHSKNKLENNIFTIVFFGKTGTGKSTTLNKLFKLNLDTDNAIACTKEPQKIFILKKSNNFLYYKTQFQVIDMPGISESIEKDELYIPYYEEWMPKTDRLIWITQADTRAYKKDQVFLSKLIELFNSSISFFVGINKIDVISADKKEDLFDTNLNQPSRLQLEYINEKIEDVYKNFQYVINERIHFERKHIIPYTAFYGWGLDNLKSNILY